MNTICKSFFFIALLTLVSCGGKEEKKESETIQIGSVEKKDPVKTDAAPPKTAMIDMNNKGVGPIKSIELGAIDQGMVKRGEEVFKSKCMACHKPDKKFIGPAPTGIMDRRAPEWIMNMILNPEEMVQKDPIAKQLLIDYNGSPMANQNLTEAEAREVLEYFRTLK